MYSGVPSRPLTARPLSSGSHAPCNARVRLLRPLTEPVSAWAARPLAIVVLLLMSASSRSRFDHERMIVTV
jgi:hypothetical protein